MPMCYSAGAVSLPLSAIRKDETETRGLFSCDNLDTRLLFGRAYVREGC